MADDTTTEVRISDDRKESSYTYREESGLSKTVTIVEFPTVDDIMALGARSVAGGIISGDNSYSSVMDYELVSKLVRVHMPVER